MDLFVRGNAFLDYWECLASSFNSTKERPGIDASLKLQLLQFCGDARARYQDRLFRAKKLYAETGFQTSTNSSSQLLGSPPATTESAESSGQKHGLSLIQLRQDKYNDTAPPATVVHTFMRSLEAELFAVAFTGSSKLLKPDAKRGKPGAKAKATSKSKAKESKVDCKSEAEAEDDDHQYEDVTRCVERADSELEPLDEGHDIRSDVGMDKVMYDGNSKAFYVDSGPCSSLVLNYVGKVSLIPTVGSLKIATAWGLSFYVEAGHYANVDRDMVIASWLVPSADKQKKGVANSKNASYLLMQLHQTTFQYKFSWNCLVKRQSIVVKVTLYSLRWNGSEVSGKSFLTRESSDAFQKPVVPEQQHTCTPNLSSTCVSCGS